MNSRMVRTVMAGWERERKAMFSIRTPVFIQDQQVPVAASGLRLFWN